MNRHTSYTIYNNIQRVLTNRIRIILMIVLACAMAGNIQARKKTGSVTSDRQQWADLCYRIARPVLENMSRGELQKNMQLELSPTWDGRDRRVAYMETFGRLMAGISPGSRCPTTTPPKDAAAASSVSGR